MYTYNIRFTRNGETETINGHYKASCIAAAFEKCLRRNPDAELIEGKIEGSYRDAYGVVRRGTIVYAPPSTVRITVTPGPNEEQTAFAFLETLSAGGPHQLRNQNAK
jgi:hypothetical protein